MHYYIWIDGVREEYSVDNDYRNRTIHREDGPARILGIRKEWWLNGYYHREDGAAIEWTDGSKEWYLNGNEIPKEWMKNNIADKTNLTEDEKLLLKLTWW